MVLTTDSKFLEIYNIIKENSLQGESVLILVARDCDSIAACKILTEILKSDQISYNVKPVSGYEDLVKVNNLLLDNEEIKSIIMINCGGNIEITKVFSNLKDQVVYIVDSHRPYNQKNIDDGQFSLIIDDGTFGPDEEEDVKKEEEEEDEEEEEEEEEEENDDEDDENMQDRDEEGIDAQEDLINELLNDSADNIDEDLGDEIIDENEMKRKKSKKEKNNNSNSNGTKNKRKYSTINYFQTKDNNNEDDSDDSDNEDDNLNIEKSYYGKSAAVIMYKLSSVLIKHNLDGLLWYAILGLTDQFIHERISLESYEQQYLEFKSLVLNEYPDDAEQDQSYVMGHKILPIDDFKFMLYRHWNLHDSLFNSQYIACKLKIWKAHGRHLLQTLFAMMGIPIEQTKQNYISMNSNFKSNLKRQLENHAPKFGLNNLYYRSFLKKYECNIELSASDTVYAITALMESDNLETDQSDEEIWEQNFWDAYDSISNKNIDLLKIGLKQSIVLQKEITRQVTSMIEKRIVILSGPFRYAFITENSELKLFIHPLALTKLGLFMMDAFTAMNKPVKPFLIGALNAKKDNYLIVGISGSHGSDFHSNQFGVYFRKAAETTNASLKYQSFDTSVIEISKIDMPKFIEQLHSSLV